MEAVGRQTFEVLNSNLISEWLCQRK